MRAPRQSLTRQLFLKAIGQYLRIKTVIGTSGSAERIQIWTALIAMLLLYLHVRSTWRWTCSNMGALLRQQIFVYRDLWELLDQPWNPPVDLDEVELAFAWAAVRPEYWTAGQLRRRTRIKKE